MFTLRDDFKTCDKNKQPYSFTVERHTDVENLHSAVQNRTFSLRSVGNRYILNSPAFSEGAFSMNFKITYMASLDEVLGETVESEYPFSIYLGYDVQERTGLKLKLSYSQSGCFDVSLYSFSASEELFLSTSRLEMTLEEEFYPLSVLVHKNNLVVMVNDEECCFDCSIPRGRLAIDRENFVGELILSDISFVSSENFDKTKLFSAKTEIPCINGGDIPYTMQWEVYRIAENLYLTYSLDGGTKTRFYNPDDRPGQYVSEMDVMTNPYVGVCDNGREAVFRLMEGANVFLDSNFHWKEVLGRYLGDTDLPQEGMVLLPFSDVSSHTQFIFGYENLNCKGYVMQSGECEFRYYAQSGELAYMGPAPDGRNIFELFSLENKFALSLIPLDTYKRDEVINHVKYNHYFEVSEELVFKLCLKTKLPTDFLKIRASLVNVYETQILESPILETCVGEWDYGYKLISAEVRFSKRGIGVYKISFEILYGDKVMDSYIKTFEVFDKNSSVNPAVASGLPYIFSMPNEQKWLMRNAFDLWNPMPSCDSVHYFSCITDTPIEARTREVWKLSRSFKRDWFAWVGPRTTRDYNPDNNIDIIENADYINLTLQNELSCRPNLWRYDSFANKSMLKLLHSFLKDNPDMAAELNYHEGCAEFTRDHYEELMSLCLNEWLRYATDAVVASLEKRNEIIKKYNPGAKTAAYGPLPIYANSSSAYIGLMGFGMPYDKRLSEIVYTGFAILEDYPFSCSYQTYRGPFLAMTMLLHCPELVIYPEQYSGGMGGCIDGAVKFANPPMGKYALTPAQTMTHSFEYVFNTPYRLDSGYQYWNTYGFHRGGRTPQDTEEMVRLWHYVVENKPKRPLRTLAFVAEYDEKENVYDTSLLSRDAYNLYNRSESAHAYIHECSRQAGVSNGFGIRPESLSTLSTDECDLLILPTLEGFSPEHIKEIRRLYDEGVNLIAVSDVTGLEDIFGVKKTRTTLKVHSVSYAGKTENIFNMQAEFDYEPCTGSKMLMLANGVAPAVIATDRTALINTALINLGGECFKWDYSKSKHITGALITEVLTDLIRLLSKPLAIGENIGITLFENVSGETVLLAIDYSPFDNSGKKETQASIKLYMDDVTDAVSDQNIWVAKKDGIVKEIRFNIGVHGSVFIKLKRKDD